MSFIGTAGVVAQQGNQAASAPTSVSVATTSSGNHDNAFVTKAFGDGTYQSEIHMQVGSVFSSNTGETQLDITNLNNFSAGNYITIYIAAYLRATGATSYSWTLDSLASSISSPGSFTPAIHTNNYNAQQDNTFNNEVDGIGGYLKIDAGGGRGGLTWGNANDYVEFDVTGTATNGTGSTDSDTITLKIVWTAGDSGD
jgi:hypothetical protein